MPSRCICVTNYKKEQNLYVVTFMTVIIFVIIFVVSSALHMYIRLRLYIHKCYFFHVSIYSISSLRVDEEENC